MRLAAALVLSLTTGCLRGGDRASDDDWECVRDADCDGECTRTNECIEAGTAIRVEVAWTVAGAAAAEASCAPIGELEVVFFAGEEEAESYAPIPCPIGRSTYDKMPPWLDRVEMIAYGADGGVVDDQSASVAPSGTTAITFDLLQP